MRLLLMCLWLFTILPAAIYPTFAQNEGTAEPDLADWSVEERCIQASTPPDHWTFEGTLLMRGHYGIHAYQAGWDTPQVVVFLQPGNALRGGALSPDGNWYAYPWGEFSVSETYNAVTSVRELRVHSTRDERVYSVPTYTEGFQTTYKQAYWLDDDHVLFENWDPSFAGVVRIGPFEGQIEVWEQFSSTFDQLPARLYPSPDWGDLVALYPPSVWATSTSEWQLYSQQNGRYIPITTLPLSDPYNPIPVAWQSDSSQFAAQIDTDESIYLALFSRQGEVVDRIMTVKEGHHITPINFQWSADGRYLAFVIAADGIWQTFLDSTFPNYASLDYGVNRLFIADTQDRKVIDTCLEVGIGMAWSPETTQLTLIPSGEGQIPLQILDMETFELHTVTYHGVSYTQLNNDVQVILGWRLS